MKKFSWLPAILLVGIFAFIGCSSGNTGGNSGNQGGDSGNQGGVPEKIKYSITSQYVENGGIDIYQDVAFSGDTVFFNVYAYDGYEVREVYVDGSWVGDTSGEYSFIMPDHDVVISFSVEAVEIQKQYSITSQYVENGGIDIYQDVAFSGDTVYFSVYAYEGYVVKEVYAGDELLGEGSGDYSFTMPANDVEIRVTIKKNSGGMGIIIQ